MNNEKMLEKEVRPKITLKKIFGHLHTVNKHRFIVMKLCFKAGIPFRGLVHDLSKYSPEEFLEGARYYAGDHSPIKDCKRIEGYSKAWLHHLGRNKHHFEYWNDYLSPNQTPLIPYKYTVEMICDNLAAGMAYQGKHWYSGYQLDYYNRTTKNKDIRMNDKNKKMLEVAFTMVRDEGLKKTINKKTLRKIYDEIAYGE